MWTCSCTVGKKKVPFSLAIENGEPYKSVFRNSRA